VALTQIAQQVRRNVGRLTAITDQQPSSSPAAHHPSPSNPDLIGREELSLFPGSIGHEAVPERRTFPAAIPMAKPMMVGRLQDLLDKSTTFVPEYTSDILNLISGPKSFVLERISTDLSIAKALLFLVTSTLFAWIIETPFQKEITLVSSVRDAALFLLMTITYGAAVYFAWRIVKGHTDIRTVFIIHFYYASVIRIIIACGFLTIVGVIRATDPAFYAEFMNAVCEVQIDFVLHASQRFWASRSSIPLVVSYLLFSLLLAVWIVAGWGAYREISKVSKVRSSMAFILFVIFSIPITVLLGAISSASVRCGSA
jgi:hypothetical protein